VSTTRPASTFQAYTKNKEFAYTIHCHYITLRALVVQLLLMLQTSLLVGADEQQPSTTITTTSTTVVSTKWVVITSAAGSLVTYTTSTFATGSTVGIATIVGSTVDSTEIARPSGETLASADVNMAWEGRGFTDAVLNSTNQYRSQHEASALKWNQTLASYAQDHADGCEMKHTGGPYGENLAQGYATPTLAIDGWANEESDYNYEKRKFSNEVGHFTQLVWKNTTSVGCGAADCNDAGWLLFCEYWPPGNVIGEFGGNVGKLGQGENGEPGMSDVSTADVDGSDQSGDDQSDTGGSAGRSIGGRLLVALVAMSVFASLYA